MMKTIFTSIAGLAVFCSFGQNFINGSFEITSSTGCDYNNSAPEFNDAMEAVYLFSGDEADIHEATCYVATIPEGNKAVGISHFDGITIELTEDLVLGSSYTITFWIYSNWNFVEFTAQVDVGCSMTSDAEGDNIGTAIASTAYAWEEKSITFVAPNNGRFISIINTDDTPGWNQLDDFRIELIEDTDPSGIEEEENVVSIYPNPTNGDITIVQEGTFDYSVTTIDGKVLVNETATNQELISLADYAEGVYYVTMIINNERSVYKVIKQ